MRWWLSMLILVLAAGACRAQSALPASGTIDDAAGDAQDHGWVCLPVRDVSVVLHLPPGAGRGGVAPLGLAAKLNELPAAIAAQGRDLYLCFEPSGEGELASRRVLRLSATPTPGTTRWAYSGAERLAPMASIQGDGDLLGFESTSDGLWSLVERPTGFELLQLVGQGWSTVAMPAGAGASRLSLSTSGDDLLLIEHGDSPRLWTLKDEWRRSAPGVESMLHGLEPRHRLLGIGDRLAWLDDAGALIVVGDNVRFEFDGRVQPGEDVGFLTNGATATALIFIRDRQDLESLGDLRLRRVSVVTGEIVNEAEASVTGPVTGAQFILVLAMLAGVLMMILTFVFWPEQQSEPRLPDHVVIATSSRRLVAGSVDLMLGVIPAALIVGVPIRDVVLPGLSGDPMASLVAGILAVAIACAQSAVMEILMSRSIGKAAMGLEVYGLSNGVVARLTMRQALLRNVVRWWLAPAALAGLCRTWRHVGDMVAGTVVTQAAEAAEDEA